MSETNTCKSRFNGKKLFGEWVDYRKLKGGSERSIAPAKTYVLDFFRYTGNRRSIGKLEDITVMDFAAWRDYLLKAKKLKPKSVNAAMGYVLGIYKMKWEQTLSTKWKNRYNDMRMVPKPSMRNATGWDPVPLKDLTKLIHASKEVPKDYPYYCAFSESYPMLMANLYTGLRAESVGGLMVEWLDFEGEVINVPLVKGGKAASIPFHKDLQTILKEHLEARPYESDFVFYRGKDYDTPNMRRRNAVTCRTVIEKVSIKAGLTGSKRVVPHRLRKTVATYLESINVPPKIIQAILTHANISTTMNIYTKPSMERVQEEFSKASFLEKGDQGPNGGQLKGLGALSELSPETLDRLVTLAELPEEKLDKILRAAEILGGGT